MTTSWRARWPPTISRRARPPTPGAEADALAIQARLALSAAAERSASLGAHAQALAQLRHAVEIATEPSDRAAFLIRAARSADATGAYTEAESFAREAATVATEIGDTTAAARAQAILGAILITAGQTRDAVVALEAALAALPESEVGEARAEILTNLARAYFRNDDHPAAIAAADKALPIAERLELDRIIAEAFNNKAAGLSASGRRRESVALMQAAVELAHAGGHLVAELRSLSNLASVVSNEDPRRSHAATLASLELARRVGHRSMATWALWFHGWWSYLEGRDWDGPLSETLDEIDKGLAPTDEARLLMTVINIRANRGEPFDDLLARREMLLAGTTDPFLRATQHWLRATGDFTAGDYDAAFDGYVQAAITGAVYGLGIAARAALWKRDPERLRTAIARLDERSRGADGRPPAVDGRARAASRGSRVATPKRLPDTARSSGALTRWDRTSRGLSSTLDFLLAVGADEPEARQAAEASRPMFERLRAQPYLDKLDAALGAPQPDRGEGLRFDDRAEPSGVRQLGR